jgi:hypothetical protein
MANSGTVTDPFSQFSETPSGTSRRAIAAVITVTAIVAALNLWSVTWSVAAYLATATLPVGLLLLADARLRWTISRRLGRASYTPIRSTNGGPAAVRGHIVPSEAGLFISPLSGRSAVWARLEVFQDDVEGTTAIKSLTAARDFLIDDGSGELALVVAERAWVTVESNPPHRPPHRIEEIDPATRAFLEARGLRGRASSNKGGGDGRHLTETVLAPGDEVVAVGPALRAPIAAGSAAATQLVLKGRIGRVDELLVASWPPSAIRRPTFVIPLGAAMVVTGCAPLIVAWWSYCVHRR